jgi:hypothetical protein
VVSYDQNLYHEIHDFITIPEKMSYSDSQLLDSKCWLSLLHDKILHNLELGLFVILSSYLIT